MAKSPNSYLQITGFKRIQNAENGKIFRHITLLDTTNQKTVDYVIFKTDDDRIWADILEENLNNIAYSGEILSYTVTEKAINEIRSQFRLKIKEGDIIDIVLWSDDGWDPIDHENRVIHSLQKQIWRFRELPKR